MKSVIAWRAVCLLFVHAFGSRINCYSNESDLKASHLLPLISSMHILVGLFSRTEARQDFCEMSNIIESVSLFFCQPVFCAYDKHVFSVLGFQKPQAFHGKKARRRRPL